MAISAGQDVLASDFINESEANATPASDVGRVPKIESNGQISNIWMPIDFGDGSDGDVTISTPTTLTRDMYYNNLVVTDTLTTDGYRIFVKGTISGAGTITWGTANAGTDSITQSGGAGGGQTGGGFYKNNAGTAGADAVNGASSGTNSPVPASVDHSLGNNGGTGGNGGNGDSGSEFSNGAVAVAGAPDTPIGIFRAFSLAMFDIGASGINPYKSSPGGGGGGHGSRGNTSGSADAGGGGGGGGASGGIVWIAARIWAGTFTIRSVGANGGHGGQGGQDGGGGGGGGGGAGGVSVFFYERKTWSGSYVLTGGTGGAAGLPGPSDAPAAGTAGSNGSTGESYEIEIGRLL